MTAEERESLILEIGEKILAGNTPSRAILQAAGEVLLRKIEEVAPNTPPEMKAFGLGLMLETTNLDEDLCREMGKVFIATVKKMYGGEEC